MKKTPLFLVVCLALLFSGCMTVDGPQKTSLELQAMQANEFETTKTTAFASVLSVFQDLGYIVGSAEVGTGFITAKSPTKGGFRPFVGSVMEHTNATAFVEQIATNRTKVRLNFVTSKQTSSGYGMKGESEVPIEDPATYQNAFAKIREAIFIRSATK